MQEQTLEKSDETIGIKSIVKKNGDYARISVGKLGDHFNVNDEVYVLTPSEHSQYLQLRKDAENYIAKINQLEFEINNAEIRTLKKDNEDLKRQIKNKDNSINTYKTNSVKNKAKIEDLQHKVDNYKKTLADKDATITSLTSENNKLKFAVSEQANTISSNDSTIEDLNNTIDEIKEHNDAIAKQLEDSIDESEHQQLKDKVATLSDKLKDAENNATYWQNSYNGMIDSSDALANKNESLIAENEKLRNDNNAVNETNQLLNENLIAANNTFNETKQELQLDSNLAQVVIGVRRSGKSTLCQKVLIEKGVNFAYVNFDDERLRKAKTDDLDDVLQMLYEIYGDFTHLFLDEVQNVKDWPLFVNRLLRQKMRLIITGSNANLLSGELATHLTGRYHKIELFPFSFAEVCRMNNVNMHSGSVKAIGLRQQ